MQLYAEDQKVDGFIVKGTYFPAFALIIIIV
jgi:hypothetical protein